MIIFLRLFTVYRTVKGQVIIMNNEVLLTKTQVCRIYGITRATFESYKAAGYIKPFKKSLSGAIYLYNEADIKPMLEKVNEALSEYCTFEQAAKLVGVHPQTLRIAVHDGRLRSSHPPFAVGNFVFYKREDVEELIASLYLGRRKRK